ncbi:MAG TPA: RHS repeat-associated core domain-containing protein [Terriglobia bacterium]|nr:RHS repeat-associated core domain-containing protein [Terriglobia bacterium]
MNYNLSYNYDPWGNMSCTSGGTGVCPQYSYGINGNYSTTNQITNSGYTYDAAGNLTADGTGSGAYTYTYDGEGRLTVVSSSTLTFLYNALGQAVQWTQSGVTYDMLYDASGEMMARFNEASGNWDTAPFRLGHRMLGTYDFGSNVTHFLHANALGSSTVITDGTGSVVAEQLFYPSGDLWQDTSQQEFHFAAFDWGYANPGVLPTPNRMYSYTKGRWMTPDPVGLAAADITNPESLNRYAYALNSPTSLIDPSGLGPFAPIDPGCIGEDSAGFPWDICGGGALPIIPVIIGGGGGVGGGGGGGTGGASPDSTLSFQAPISHR